LKIMGVGKKIRNNRRDNKGVEKNKYEMIR
jgi:hypothetical protein